MRCSFVLIACILLFAQCRKTHAPYSFASHKDTLAINWGVVEGAHITYHFQNASNWTDEVTEYVREHEAAYEHIDAVFKAQLPQKLRFYIWVDTALARKTLGRTLGFATPSQCIVNIRPEQTLGHEMTHILSYWADGITPTVGTRFVNEGVAVAFDLTATPRIEKAKSVLAQVKYNSVLELWENGNQIPESVLYPVAGAFMEFLYQKNQYDKFIALIRNQTIESAEVIYGKTEFDKLIAEFDQRVGL